MPYRQVWLEIALQQIDGLPAELQAQARQRVEQLLEHPELPPTAYNPATDQWITTFGNGAGLLVLAITHEHRAVIILRLV